MDPSGDASGSEVSTLAHRIAPPPVSRLRLVVVEGPDKGKIFVLDPDAPSRLLVGTSPACAIRFSDQTVSRRHAAFEPTPRGAYRLNDLDSTNGTVVDGVRIGEAFVRGGEIVRFGGTAAELEALEPSSEDEEPETTYPKHPNATGFGKTVGASSAMRRLYPLCAVLAKTRVPVVIEGETGTGKEVLAESLHEVGTGASGRPFVVFDCTTVSPNLVEAELFGHVKGAFTGADRARSGVFEEADGGTLLIDEIGDLALTLQAKLLRVIDRGELRRVGAVNATRVDVRILAATRRDLDKEVAAGRFRDDLFHRLAVARIELPPLRERHGDVPLLVRSFVEEMGGDRTMAGEILARVGDYTWPGNVRELRNFVARFIALGADADVLPAMSPRPGASVPPPSAEGWLEGLLAQDVPYPIARRRAIEEFERRYVSSILARHGGNVSMAAKASGLALRYFRLVRARQK